VKRLGELVGRELNWVHPDWRRMEYELQDGTECAATLRFRTTWGTHATAESGDGCWTFKRVGFLQTRATIRACGADDELASFRNNAWKGGGILELPDGRRYPANTNFWMTSFDFTTEAGDPLVTYRRIGGLLQLSSAMEIQPAAVSVGEFPWIAMLGWYLAVQLHRDSALAGTGGGGG